MGGATKVLTLELTGRNPGLARMLTDSDKKVQAFKKSVDDSNKSMSLSQAVVKGAAVGITALAAGLTYAISKAVAFDKAMRNVNSLTKLNETQFAAMEKQVISMSTKLPQSATTLAEGLYDIASSGFQGADGIKVLDAAARSASAGLTTTEVSAKAITAVLNAYGLQAKDAADVSDVLFSTVNLGVISFEELAGNLGDVVGASAAAKVSIDQVGAAIATMTLSGIKGAQATTALSSLTTKLVQPSEALAKLYKQLGYESGAAALEQKGLRGVMEDVRKATGGNITAMLQLFPDIEAARGAMALMANDGQNYAKVADQITDKTKRMGSTQQVLDEQMKSVSAQWQLFTNRIDAAAVSLGVKLLPAISEGMDTLGDWGAAIGKFAMELKTGAASGLDDLGESVGNVVDFLKQLGEMALAVAKPLGQLAAGGAVETFNLLAGALSEVTQFASENEKIIMALGIAYAVHATGGVTALMGGLEAAEKFLGGNWRHRMYDAAEAALSLGDRMRDAGNKAKVFAQAVAPAVSVGAALTVAITAWSSYTEGANEAAEVTKKTEQAMNSFNIDEMAQAIKQANEMIASTQKQLAEFGNADNKIDMGTLFDFQDNYKLLGMVDNLDQVQAAADEAKLKLGQMQYNTVELFKVMGQPLPDEAKWINDVQGANGASAQAAAMAQMSMILDQLGPKLKAAGVDMTKAWDTQQMTNAYSALQGVKDGSDQAAAAQQKVITAMGGAAASMGDATSAASALRTALDGLTGAAIGVDQAQINWLNGLAQLKATLKENGATIAMNTQKGRDNRTAMIGQVQILQDMLVASAEAGAGQAELTGKLSSGRSALIATGVAAGIPKKAMEALLAQYKLTPELVQTLIKESGAASTKEKLKQVAAEADRLNKKKPTPKVSAETSVAQSRLNSVQARLDQIDGRIATSTVRVNTIQNTYKNMIETHTSSGVGVRVNENGGLWLNSYAGGKLPDQAMIMAPKGDYGLVQWAEKRTGGEAFIPMAPDKRPQSERILSAVADQFGLMLVEKFVSGGFRYPAFKYPAFKYDKKAGSSRAAQYQQYQADRKAKLREYENNRYAALEEARERQRLLSSARGRSGAGLFQATDEAGSTLANLGQAYEGRAQAIAELKARQSRNPSDTAEDFYKKPTLSVKQYIGALQMAEKTQRQWASTTSGLASRVGSDVVNSLKAMGEDGEAAIKKMASASVKDMKAMADSIRRLNFANFMTDLNADVKGQAQFQANLAALTKMGRGDLAARFAQMGYDQAAGLAAQAVKSPGSTLTQLNDLLAKQEGYNDPLLQDAYKLSQAIARSGGKIGVIGLSNTTGMSLADILGLLQRFNSQVFANIPASQMKQVAADLALIKAGKQPSGLAYGAIVRGTDTGYYWGEPSSGGESLIPHGLDRRRRALQLWRETGRILGAGGMGSSGGVVISPGAIQVELTVTQAGATAAQIEQGARRVVNTAMGDLERLLTQGSR